MTNICFAAYMSSPCHIELILSEKEEPVKKEVVHRNILYLNASVDIRIAPLYQSHGLQLFYKNIIWIASNKAILPILQPEMQVASGNKRSKALHSGVSS